MLSKRTLSLPLYIFNKIEVAVFEEWVVVRGFRLQYCTLLWKMEVALFVLAHVTRSKSNFFAAIATV